MREIVQRRATGTYQVVALLKVAYLRRTNTPLCALDAALMITSPELLPAATRADAARLKALVRRQYDLAVPLSYESRPHSIGSIFVRRPGQPFRRFDPRLDLVDWSEDGAPLADDDEADSEGASGTHEPRAQQEPERGT